VDDSLLRSWLALPAGPWPPDHYTLLGLAPGRADPAAVEPRVMERMDRLRTHQLLHPDLVTEGMNRLAQALITLTDPVEKAAYDAEIGAAVAAAVAAPGKVAPAPAVPVAPAAGALVVGELVFDDVFSDDLPAAPPDGSDVTQVIELPGAGSGPAPKVIDWAKDRPAPPPRPYEVVPHEVVPDEPKPAPLSLDADEPARPAPPAVVEAVAAAADNPAGRRWVYARLALLRRAQQAWDRLGPVFGDPQDPVDRPGRVLLVLDAVAAVRPLLPGLRGVVGGVDDPGGVVAAVAAQPLVLDTFRRLLPDQRQALAIDWRRGREELRTEYARLRRLSRSNRDRRAGTRGGMALVRWVRETPELALVLLAGLALAAALLRTLRH
jgi:hypothetical protein